MSVNRIIIIIITGHQIPCKTLMHMSSNLQDNCANIVVTNPVLHVRKLRLNEVNCLTHSQVFSSIEDRCTFM